MMHPEVKRAYDRYLATAGEDTGRTLLFQTKRYVDALPLDFDQRSAIKTFDLGPEAGDIGRAADMVAGWLARAMR
jgi:hypothetical protein